MVSHTSEYCWSSYARNTTGKPSPLVGPHPLYDELDNDVRKRHYACRELFRMHMDQAQVHS